MYELLKFTPMNPWSLANGIKIFLERTTKVSVRKLRQKENAKIHYFFGVIYDRARCYPKNMRKVVSVPIPLAIIMVISHYLILRGSMDAVMR